MRISSEKITESEVELYSLVYLSYDFSKSYIYFLVGHILNSKLILNYYRYQHLEMTLTKLNTFEKDDSSNIISNNALSCHLLFTISCVFVSVFQGLMIVESQKYFYLYGSSSSMKIVILGLLSILFGFVALFSVIMLLMGWISSLRGQTRSLPIIGGFKFFK